MNPATAHRPSLTITDLTVSRGGRTLFAGLELAAGAGDVVMLRGRNGAGKTSLLLAIAGHLRPDAGTIAYRAGPNTDIGRNLHFMATLPGFKPRLSVAENLNFWQALNGPTGQPPEAALKRAGLGGLGDIEAGHLSTGQLRRLALARLLVSHRPLWLLDEPTATLDRDGAALVAELIAEHRANGGIVIAATHLDLALAGTISAIELGPA